MNTYLCFRVKKKGHSELTVAQLYAGDAIHISAKAVDVQVVEAESIESIQVRWTKAETTDVG